jgi:phosphatidate cytidylyltransferase
MVATAGTVPPTDKKALRKRIASALVLVPVVVAAAYWGPPIWDVLVALMGVAMAWEWSRLCGSGRTTRAGTLTLIVPPAVIVMADVWNWSAALAALGVCVLFAAVADWLKRWRSFPWHALGVAYIGLPCLAMVWLRSMPGAGLPTLLWVLDAGLLTLLWVLALVWAVDTGAYVTGRGIGGPKLAPHISPNKTWAGLVGGMVAGGAVGLAAAQVVQDASSCVLVPVSMVLAIVEQAGDLFESSVKRHFGVKDASALIPGHGGVLDRVDGLVAVSLVVAALSWAVGHTILIWS